MQGMRFLMLALCCAAAANAFAAGFVESLSPEERTKLGLENLTAEQRRALDAAVDRYREGGEQKAAVAAVEEYKRKEEPRVVAQAVQKQKAAAAAASVERIQSKIKGKFRGWFGGTIFELENGQIWKQTSSETYAATVVDSPEVEISKSNYGYFRLRLQDGAWVNVKRIK
jgi:cell pole-organizing protein PopZ